MDTDAEWVVKRQVELDAAVAAGQQQAMQAILVQVPGIRQVEVQPDGKRVCVTYDRGWLGFAELAGAFAQAGYPLRHGGWMGVKPAWYARQDRKARVSGKLPESACCGQPPDFSQEKDR